MSDLKVAGKLHVKGDTQQVSEKFKKREFVLEISEEINGNIYTNYAKMQLVQNKVEILDRYQIGQDITVSFNIKGNRWEKDGKVNYITSLDAWKIEAVAEQAAPAPAAEYVPDFGPAPMTPSAAGSAVDNLPF